MKTTKILIVLQAFMLAGYIANASAQDTNKADLLSIYSNPFKYSNYPLDPESDMYNCKARMLSPKFMRFNSRDTLALPNRYAYCSANPVMYTDPRGHNKVSFRMLNLVRRGLMGIVREEDRIENRIEQSVGIEESLKTYFRGESLTRKFLCLTQGIKCVKVLRTYGEGASYNCMQKAFEEAENTLKIVCQSLADYADPELGKSETGKSLASALWLNLSTAEAGAEYCRGGITYVKMQRVLKEMVSGPRRNRMRTVMARINEEPTPNERELGGPGVELIEYPRVIGPGGAMVTRLSAEIFVRYQLSQRLEAGELGELGTRRLDYSDGFLCSWTPEGDDVIPTPGMFLYVDPI